MTTEVTNGVSIVSSVRNREESLRKTLPTWINNQGVDQIVIVDWSSDESLEDYIREQNCKKIIYVRVDKQKFYYITLSTNFAAQFATKNKLLFLNADIILKEDFFDKHKLRKGIFYTGNWRIARNENETHLNGQFFVHRSDFFRVNGYDERLRSYGWDDSDLYYRLTLPNFILNNAKYFSTTLFWNFPPKLLFGGLKRLDISPDCLEHIPHSDQARVESYPGFSPSPKESIQANRIISISRQPWNKSFARARYEISPIDANFCKAQQIDDNFFAIKPVNGLGNRLRVIASCWAVSEILGKKLYVCWSGSSGFSDETFESLFATSFEFISEATYRQLEADPRNIVINNRIKIDTEYTTIESGGYRDLPFWTEEIDHANLLYEWSNSLDHVSRYEIKKHKALRDFDQVFAQKLKLLKPAENIQALVSDFAKKNFSTNKVLGFHIRKGDAIQSPWAKEYQTTTDDLFLYKIKKEVEKDDKVKIFLATDCSDTLTKFVDLFSDRIIYYNKEFVESKFGLAKKNQAEAFIEMLLLSRTSKIIGTRWSTFSEMASKIGDIELEICAKN